MSRLEEYKKSIDVGSSTTVTQQGAKAIEEGERRAFRPLSKKERRALRKKQESEGTEAAFAYLDLEQAFRPTPTNDFQSPPELSPEPQELLVQQTENMSPIADSRFATVRKMALAIAQKLLHF